MEVPIHTAFVASTQPEEVGLPVAGSNERRGGQSSGRPSEPSLSSYQPGRPTALPRPPPREMHPKTKDEGCGRDIVAIVLVLDYDY
jgi:hypothetical protein